MTINVSKLIAFERLSLDEARRQLLQQEPTDIDLALRTFMKEHRADRRIGRVLEVLLGPCAIRSELRTDEVSRVSTAVSNLLWKTARDPTYGGNIRNVVNYYKTCNLQSRGLMLQGLIQMLDVDGMHEDARVVISGLPIFSGWENGPPNEGHRELGERLKGERINPVAPRRKSRPESQRGK